VKVLVVLTQPPLPEGGAPGRCAIGLIRGLTAHGVDVKAVAARRHFSAPGDPPPDLPVEVVDLAAEPGRRSPVDRLRRPLSELAVPAFLERVHAAASDADLVHLEETETAWCDAGLQLPSLVHIHYLVRRDRPLGAPWHRDFGHALETHLAERAAMRRHHYLVASSPLIGERLQEVAPLAHVTHAPLSLDPRYYAPAQLDGSPLAGIIGTATWPPTAAAIRALVDDVWPDVQRNAPDARLVIAGRGSEGVAVGHVPGVQRLGEVPSSVDFLRGLSVLLFPLARGSGMKVKVLEALAMGVPVVTTPAGAEGIPPSDGVVVATGTSALATAATSILRDAGERRERGRSARRLFETSFTPEVATAPLLPLYERMLAHANPREGR
jgi:glycosyltransferase involved in cell wall biosynthesis